MRLPVESDTLEDILKLLKDADKPAQPLPRRLEEAFAEKKAKAS